VERGVLLGVSNAPYSKGAWHQRSLILWVPLLLRLPTRVDVEGPHYTYRQGTYFKGSATPLHLHRCVARFVSDNGVTSLVRRMNGPGAGKEILPLVQRSVFRTTWVRWYQTVTPFWILIFLQREMMELLAVTSGTLKFANLRSDHHHQHTNTRFLYMPDAPPTAPKRNAECNMLMCLNEIL